MQLATLSSTDENEVIDLCFSELILAATDTEIELWFKPTKEKGESYYSFPSSYSYIELRTSDLRERQAESGKPSPENVQSDQLSNIE